SLPAPALPSFPTRRSSDLNNCDEFIYYDDLVRQDEQKRRAAKKRKEAAPTGEDKKQEAFDVVLETLNALIAERGAEEKIWGSMRSEEHTSELQSRGHLVCR